MKTLLLTGLLAAAALAAGPATRAHAWKDLRWGAGFDWQSRGGGHRLPGGLWESAPGPGGPWPGWGPFSAGYYGPGLDGGGFGALPYFTPAGLPPPPGGAPAGTAPPSYPPAGYSPNFLNPYLVPTYAAPPYYGQ